MLTGWSRVLDAAVKVYEAKQEDKREGERRRNKVARHQSQGSDEYPHSYSDSEYGKPRAGSSKSSKQKEKDKRGADRQRDRMSHMAASLF